MVSLFSRFFKPIFFSRRFYWSLVGVICLFIISYSLPFLFPITKLLLVIFWCFVLFDYFILFSRSKVALAKRKLTDRFSNGDENHVRLYVENLLPFKVNIRLIDELPDQFQRRNFLLSFTLPSNTGSEQEYVLRPTERGEYFFHNINLFVKTPIGLMVRHVVINAEKMVKVYPSYFALRHFELMAYSNDLAESGSRKIRKIGHSLEFEQIKEYVTGDDIRSINWKATARKGGQLMVNNYIDERSQQVYCLIDKGRVMKMPFNGLSLLDYAINASLVLSRVALLRQDRAGLITFAEDIGNFVAADRKSSQMGTILENLYNQETRFMETDYEKLFALVRTKITQRSLIVLFTNFESMSGLERQLPFIRSIARKHLMLVVFFENTELHQLADAKVKDVETLYMKTIAEKFHYEKKRIVKVLQQHGIFTILTAPEHLTINTVNKYLELKARQAI